MPKKRKYGNSGRGHGQSASNGSLPESISPADAEAALQALQSRLGYVFADRGLLIRALTHASADTEHSNERLEFLGDRVLGLVIAEKLHALYPADQEGALALKYNALARREACAVAADAAGLSAHLIMASAEVQSGGRRKLAIISGACESVIAALYLDGGMEVARAFIERYWQEAFSALNTDMRDAKTVLQEWAQSRDKHRGMPVYTQVGRMGPDHAPRFTVSVTVEGEAPQNGEGGSKREAEQDAAQKLLERLGLRS